MSSTTQNVLNSSSSLSQIHSSDISNHNEKREKHTVHWFRKGLRLHDNPALRQGLKNSTTFRCVFVIDPWFAGSSNVGINKWRFLLQCLEDLDRNIRKLNSRLFVIRGQPADALPKLFKEWGTTCLTFEEDPEPFGRVRDHNINEMCKELNIEIFSAISHTLYKLENIIERNGGRAPLTYHQFQSIIASMDPPPQPEPTITQDDVLITYTPISDDHDDKFGVPTLEELGFDTDGLKPPVWFGGETEALARLERHLERKAWVASFGRPKMTPQSLLASQTGLSPYLRFGCLSTRLFYYQLTDLYKKIKKAYPPLSLHGQLLYREFFYCAATKNPNFDKMAGNPICVQIPWDKNAEALAKWANGQTGFPWIDAIMTQLREEGWIHHLARHAVACFLTRGDLWISWEEGMKVFEELLLDADWSVNAGMWMWLSCSSFFTEFFHCYCPVRFGRKADPNGDYIRKYLPVLKNFPTKYIHEPWTAPENVQRNSKCIIGNQYPLPIVNHAIASRINMERLKQVYHQLAKYRASGIEDHTKGGSAVPSLLRAVKSTTFISSPSPTTVVENINNENDINPKINTLSENNLIIKQESAYEMQQPNNNLDNHINIINTNENEKNPVYIKMVNASNYNNIQKTYSHTYHPNMNYDYVNSYKKNNEYDNSQENQNPQYNRIILHRNIAYNMNIPSSKDVLNNSNAQDMEFNNCIDSSKINSYDLNMTSPQYEKLLNDHDHHDNTNYFENYENYKNDEHDSTNYNNESRENVKNGYIMNSEPSYAHNQSSNVPTLQITIGNNLSTDCKIKTNPG